MNSKNAINQIIPNGLEIGFDMVLNSDMPNDFKNPNK